MKSYQEAWITYRKNFGTVLFICLSFVLPLQLVLYFVINYFNLLFSLAYLPQFGQLTGFFFLTVGLCIAQIPFIKMAAQYSLNGEVKRSDCFQSLFENIFPVYVMSVLYSLLVVLGSLLFIIPGLLFLVWLATIPYVAVLENQRWWKGFKRAFAIGRKHFFKILGVIFLMWLVELVIQGVIVYCVLQFTSSFLSVSIAMMLGNMLFLPYFTFVFTNYTLDWVEIDEGHFDELGFVGQYKQDY
ncbi:hypothetical protein CLV97_1195 [Planifilum fimeticola]|uniref:Uncharacterized protein n=1 Tax=Planifilum fimeticola TaxID=201975 RepID=A0A2T0LCV8_9BACL|nr:hypothetical protein [Planifilum fimeticola]PRX39847.1 hypothetical protein CLV97_1195 [Planifilum fimeticola]